MVATSTRGSFGTETRLFGSLIVPVLILGAGLRVLLYASFRDAAFDAGTLAFALAVGVLLDALVSIVVLTPVLLGLTLFASGPAPSSLARRVAWLVGLAVLFGAIFVGVDAEFGRLRALTTLAAPLLLGAAYGTRVALERPWTRFVFLSVAFSAVSFGVAVEYFFFEEFNSRFNHIALDYVLYPGEVATNVWQSYDVPLFVGSSVGLGTFLAWRVRRKTAGLCFARLGWRARLVSAATALATVAALCCGLSFVPASLARDRITSEVANNGLMQLVRAYVTSELDYELYYATLPRDEARTRAARVLGFAPPASTSSAAGAGDFRLDRGAAGARAPASARLDAIVVLEESLGSNFVGALGAQDGVTPCFDSWCERGLLLENLVANGNRTVRGLEGVLCSFVPLPGDSITKRTPTVETATLGRAFGARGYDTCFAYGGAGAFDGMEPFMTKNGWDEFLEQQDLPPDAFTTAWGAADEYIFDALLERHARARAAGRPFFGTVMSVSNHKPYLVPQGRTPLADGAPSRRRAVAYADWALGRFLDSERARGLLDQTVVLVVGDHGARVYGAELIPVASYRIPALFVTPDAAWRGVRMPRLCSQIDLAPTLLRLTGVETDQPFLGSSLLDASDGPGRAFVQHNRDVGILTDQVLVVLGLQKTITFYRRAGRASDALALVGESDVTPEMRELARDTAAVFQTAYELQCAGNHLPAKFVAR